MSQLLKTFLIVIVIFLGISLIFSLFGQPSKISNQISISQLVGKINQNEVKKITVEGNNLKIVFSDDSQGASTKESEAGLSQTLINYGVDKEKLRGVEIEVKKADNTLANVGQILSFVLPLLFFGFFFCSECSTENTPVGKHEPNNHYIKGGKIDV